MVKEFRGFLTKTNALALAVGVIIGGAVSSLVAAVNADVLMPIIGLVLPGGDWREAKLVLRTSTDAAGVVTESAILYGHLAGMIVNFLMTSFVLFLIVRAVIRPESVVAPEPTKSCPECLETIPAAASRCRACSATVG